MEWTLECDIVYCREIVMVNPFQKKGSVERGALWTQIASNLNGLVNPKFVVTQRAVGEHLGILRRRYQKKMRQEEQESGTSPEKTELDVLLDLLGAEEIGEAEQEEASRLRQETAEQEKEKADDVRLTAMETFSETRKRKGEGDEKTQRKKRRSGGDMVLYLKERFQNEQDMRKKEMEFKQKKFELEEKNTTQTWKCNKLPPSNRCRYLSPYKTRTPYSRQQQQQFQQHMQQMANFQMALVKSQQEQQQIMLEFLSKIANKN